MFDKHKMKNAEYAIADVCVCFIVPKSCSQCVHSNRHANAACTRKMKNSMLLVAIFLLLLGYLCRRQDKILKTNGLFSHCEAASVQRTLLLLFFL